MKNRALAQIEPLRVHNGMGGNGVPVSSSKAAVKTWSTPTAQIQASRRTIKQVFEPAEIRVPVFEETQATRTVTNFEGFGCDLQSEVCRLLQPEIGRVRTRIVARPR